MYALILAGGGGTRLWPKSLEKTEVRLKEQKLDHYKEILRNKELDKIYDKAHERIRKAGKQEIERTEVKLEEPRLLIRKEKLETKEIERLEEKAHERIKEVKDHKLSLVKVRLQEPKLKETKESLRTKELENLRKQANEKIKKLSYHKIKLDKIKKETVIVRESAKNFSRRLNSIRKLLKEDKLYRAKVYYESLVKFYNKLDSEDPEILSEMYAELVKLRFDLEAKLAKKRLRDVK